MTKTAHQLLWDKEFIDKRIQEQHDYIERYPSTIERHQILTLRSSFDVLDRLKRQLENINNLKINI